MKTLTAFLMGLILFSPAPAGQTPDIPGRTLPDGTFQPKNIHATREIPPPGVMPDYPINSCWRNPEEVLSISWEPEVQLSDSFMAFYSAITEGDNGYVHAITSRGFGMEPYYARSLDTGTTWQPGYFFWQPGQGPVASDYKLFTNGNYVVFPFSGNRIFRCILSSDFGNTWSDWQQVYIPGVSASTELRDTFYVALSQDDGRTFIEYSADYGYIWHGDIPIMRYLTDVQDLAATSNALHMVNMGRRQETFYSRLILSDSDWSYPFNISDDSTHNSFLPKIAAWGDSNVLVMWVDYLYSPYAWTGDLFCRRSTDNGESWQGITQVTFNHLNLDKYMVERNDSIFVVYDEIVLDGVTNTEEIFFILSPDEGISWEEPIRLTDAPWRSIYPSLDIHENRIHVAFCDARTDTLYGSQNRLYYKRGTLSGPDKVDDTPNNIPNRIILGAYPNPFNSSTLITLNDNKGGEGNISIFDITGRKVKDLSLKEGKATWDATDSKGRKLSSGVYFAQAETPQGEKTIKLLMLK